MKYTQALAFFLVNGLMVTSAIPQLYAGASYSQNAGGAGGAPAGGSYPSAGGAPGGGAPSGGAPNGGAPSGGVPASVPYGGAPGGGDNSGISSSSASASAGGSSGGPLNVQCKRTEVSPGKFSFVCDGVNQDAISLRSEHILWLSGAGSQQQVVDIQIPNYKIEELIKAGFKTQPGQGSLINVLLKKPEQSYDAQVDTPKPQSGTPTVNLQYEPVTKTVVHYPNDKPYSPLVGPILPPLAGGRPQRQTGYQQPQYSSN